MRTVKNEIIQECPLTDKVEDLSQELGVRNEALIAEQRAHEISASFVVPDFRLAQNPNADRIVEFPKKRGWGWIRYEDEEVSLPPLPVRVVNVLLAQEEAVSLSSLAKTLHVRRDQEMRSLHNAIKRVSAPTLGGFIIARTVGEEPHYNIDPAVAFVDHRRPQLGRAQMIQELCRRYSDDPQLQRATSELFSTGERPADAQRYDSIRFESLGEENEKSLMETLDGLVGLYEKGLTNAEQERQIATIFNKLTYSFLPLARFMVLESAGYIQRSTKPTPLSGFLRHFPQNTLHRSMDDIMQFASIGVMRALQTYDKTKGSLLNFVTLGVNFEVRDGLLDGHRHMVGLTKGEIKENNTVAPRRFHVGDNEEYDLLYEAIASKPDSGEEYEQMLSEMAASSLVRHAMADPDLKESERLILSLSSGVYLEELEGFSFSCANGREFVYNNKLLSNPLFRDGLKPAQIGNILGTRTGVIYNIQERSLKRIEEIIRRRVSTRYYAEKWEGTYQWLKSD